MLFLLLQTSYKDIMGYIYLENFDRIGRVDSDGYIYAENFDRLGKIQSDGHIYDKNFNRVGRIDSEGFIYLSNMKRIGRIHRNGYVYDELFNRVGKLDGDIVNYIFGNKSKTSYPTPKRNATGESPACGIPINGTVFALIIVGLIVIYCVFSAGSEIINGMVNSFMIIIFLAVALLGGVVGMFCEENQFSTMFSVDYFFLMILWFMIVSQEDIGRGLEEIVVAIICVLIGFVIMAIVGIVVAGISYLFKALLEYLFRWKISKIVTIILLLICASIIIW